MPSDPVYSASGPSRPAPAVEAGQAPIDPLQAIVTDRSEALRKRTA